MASDHVVADRVAEKLEEQYDEVVEAYSEVGERGPQVVCIVLADDNHRRLRERLWQYPVYVEIRTKDEDTE